MSASSAEKKGVTPGAWSSGLLECHKDGKTCLCALCCPCVLAGRIAEISTDGFTDATFACCCWALIQYFTVGMCGCLYSKGFRGMLRDKYGLPSRPCVDAALHLFCPCCAFAQEYRELKARGWDPHLGYTGNVLNFSSQKVAPSPQRME
ncbi:unnamed protein product [Closterium sp. NIES-54]